MGLGMLHPHPTVVRCDVRAGVGGCGDPPRRARRLRRPGPRASRCLRARPRPVDHRGWHRAAPVCSDSGRWPSEVNICGRVSTSLTGRPTTRAASAVKITCVQDAESGPEPALPGTETRTRTSVSGRSNTVARVRRTSIGSWLASWTVSRSPSQRATVAKSPIGLGVTAAVVKTSS